MIETALVYIRTNDEEKKFIGCGSLIEGPFLATCRHVWRDAGGDDNGSILVEFPRPDAQGRTRSCVSKLVDDCTDRNPAPDLVISSIGELPTHVFPAPLATHERFETGEGQIHAFVPSRGEDVFIGIRMADLTNANGMRQITGQGASGYWTELGSSGSPAFKDGGQQLAGILRLSETGEQRIREAFVLPATLIRRYLERLKAFPVASKAGIDVDALAKAIPGLSLSDIPVSDIPQILAEAFDAIRASSEMRAAPSNIGPDIDKARREASQHLAQLDTTAALGVWDGVIEGDSAARETFNRRLLEALREKAAIHRLRQERLKALELLKEIVRLDPDDADSWIEIGDISREMVPL